MINVDAIKFKGHRCFKNDWSGFERIKPINVIIGRNNSGKSHLLDLIEAVCSDDLSNEGWVYSFEASLTEELLKPLFPENQTDRELRGNAWIEHGRCFVGQKVMWTTETNLYPKDVNFSENFDFESPYGRTSTNARLVRIKSGLKDVYHCLSGKTFRRLLADRDIRPEKVRSGPQLAPDGSGACDIVRKYILTSDQRFPRELIQQELRSAMNEIFGKDGHFSEIQIKVHDHTVINGESDWEIFLGEERKGLVALMYSDRIRLTLGVVLAG